VRRPLRVTVELFDLDAFSGALPLPSDLERLDAARFTTPELRERRISYLRCTRLVVARHLGEAPEELLISRDRSGAPLVTIRGEVRPLPLSTSRCEGLVAIATAPLGRIGVDLEHPARIAGGAGELTSLLASSRRSGLGRRHREAALAGGGIAALALAFAELEAGAKASGCSLGLRAPGRRASVVSRAIGGHLLAVATMGARPELELRIEDGALHRRLLPGDTSQAQRGAKALAGA
jgi:hypothetical protein